MQKTLFTAIQEGNFEHYHIEWTYQVYNEHNHKIHYESLTDYQKALMQAMEVNLKHSQYPESLQMFKPQVWTETETQQWLAQDLSSMHFIKPDLDKVNKARTLYKHCFGVLKLVLKIIISEKRKKDKLIIYPLAPLSDEMDLFKPDKLKIKLILEDKNTKFSIKINKETINLAVKPNVKLKLTFDFKPAHASRLNDNPNFSFKLANGEILNIDDNHDFILTQAQLKHSISMKLMINNQVLTEQLDLFDININGINCEGDLNFNFVPFDKALMIIDGHTHNIEKIWLSRQKNSINHCFYETERDYQLTLTNYQKHPSNGHCFAISQYSAKHHCWQPYNQKLEVTIPKKGFFLRTSDLQSNEYQNYDLICRGRLFEQAILENSENTLKINLTHNIKKEAYTLVIDLGTSSLCVAVYNKTLENPKILELQLETQEMGELIESDLKIYPTYVKFKPEELATSDFFPIDFVPKITLQNQVSEKTLTNIKILMLIPSIDFKVKEGPPLNYLSYDVIKPANQYFIEKITQSLEKIAQQYYINKVIFSIPNLGINSNTKGVYITAFKNISQISGYTHLQIKNHIELQQWAEVSLFSESQSVLFYYYYHLLKDQRKKQYLVFDIGAGTTDLTHAEVIEENGKTIIVTKCSICLPLAGSFIDYLMADAFINYLVKKDNELPEGQEPIIQNREMLDNQTIYPHIMDQYDKIFSRRLKDFIVSLKYHYKSTTPEYQISSLLTKSGLHNEFNTDIFNNIDSFYNEFENTPPYSAFGNTLSLLEQITKMTQGAIDNMIDLCQLKDKMNDLQIIISGRTSRFKLIQDILNQYYAEQIVFVSNDKASHEDKYAVVKGAAILADRQTRYRGLLKTRLIYPKLFLYKKNEFRKKGHHFVHLFDLNKQIEYSVTDHNAGQATYHFFISYDARPYDVKTNTPDIETFINRVYVLEHFKWENITSDPVLTFNITKEENTGVNKIHFKVYNQTQEAIIFSSEPILEEFFELGVKKGTVPWQTEGLFKQAMWPYYQDVIE